MLNRRDFITGAASGIAATTLAHTVLHATAAQAAHVNEPTEPIIGVGLNLWNYPNGETKVVHRLLIPEVGTQPPDGVTNYPATVGVMDRIGPGGNVISTIPAVTWTLFGSLVTIDATTGLPIISGNIRTEPFVAIGKDARVNARPSEHWDTRLSVSRITNFNRDNREKLWDTFVHHANLPPHDSNGGSISFGGGNGFWEAEQDNDYPRSERAVAGEILVAAWQLEGWASKRKFNVEVKFVWGGQG